jgi:hypothetical protein
MFIDLCAEPERVSEETRKVIFARSEFPQRFVIEPFSKIGHAHATQFLKKLFAGGEKDGGS